MKIGKTVLTVILAVIGAAVLVVAGFFGIMTVLEYRPADRESIEAGTFGNADGLRASVTEGDELTIMTWNLGYGALGSNADFFMDGGTGVITATKEQVNDHLDHFADGIADAGADIIFLQEVDLNSKRARRIDEKEGLERRLQDRAMSGSVTFAYNYKTRYVPMPWPPLGRVEGGLLTLSGFDVTSSERIQLPCPFGWPVRVFNLRRCLMVNRVPVTSADGADTGRELVFINLHLEAYDSGEGKAAQTKMLHDILQAEADKGNYVIAGGDFNQRFSNVDASMYPTYEGLWQCGEIDVAEFGDDFAFLTDNTYPTCRSLDRAYDGADRDSFQYYMIDGFIVSKNIEVGSVNTLNMDFADTDHNPVVMTLRLGQ